MFCDPEARALVQGKRRILAQRQPSRPAHFIPRHTNVTQQMIVEAFHPADGAAGNPVAQKVFQQSSTWKASSGLGLVQSIVSHDILHMGQRAPFTENGFSPCYQSLAAVLMITTWQISIDQSNECV
jgi:hypothetical protein